MILLHYTNILYTETMKSRICTQIDWKIRQNQNLETIKRATLRATLFLQVVIKTFNNGKEFHFFL